MPLTGHAAGRGGGRARERAEGSAPGVRRARGVRGPVAAAVGLLGELLITAGVVMGLFVAYSLWWTNVVADREAERESAEVRETWAGERDGAGPAGDFAVGDGVGFLHVPAMGDEEILVKKGTSTDLLNDGVAGYYTEPVAATPPWEGEGNFSLAAHRDGHGARFHDIHRLGEGDAVVLETEDVWYVYTVYAVLPETSRYNVEVLADIPEVSGRTEAGRYITLTTCTPVYTSRYRYVVWGELERTERVDAERTPPAELR